jgi:hypothetical protein
MGWRPHHQEVMPSNLISSARNILLIHPTLAADTVDAQ